MLLHVKTVQSNAIKTLFEVLKEILHDVNIMFDSSGMRIMTVDGSHVALVHLFLDANNFEEYHCEQTLNLGVNMTNVFKLLKTATNQDTLVMFMENNTNFELGIQIENAEKKTRTTFVLKLLDVDVEALKMPEIEFESVITMPSLYFQRLCKDMSNISDTLTIASQDNKIILSCKGDFASQETLIEDNVNMIEGLSFNTVSTERVSGNYLLKYLVLFNKASSLCNTMEIYMKNSYPLILKYKVANLGELRLCLAPKVDDEDGL
jgi:proliferating cell nuclear antigen